MATLKDIIHVIARPLEFASRSGGATIKDFGGFISKQVTEALGQHVRPADVEADLLHLAQLLADYERLSPDVRVQRVAEARAVMSRLEHAAEAPPTPRHRLWEYPMQYVRGVGPKKAEALARWGIRTMEDAVWTLPWRYEDRSQVRSIRTLVPGETAVVAATVEVAALKTTRYQRKKLVEVTVSDPTGSLHLIWFNQPYVADAFQVGRRVMLYGQAKPRNGRWTELQMENPLFELDAGGAVASRSLTHMGRIVPIYHGRETKTRGMVSDRFRAIMKIVIDEYADGAVDDLPQEMVRRLQLMDFNRALRHLHFPPAGANLEALDRGVTLAHRRLVFEDFLLLELALGRKREEVKREPRVLTYDLGHQLPDRLVKALPFRLTAAQSRVLGDIRRDLGGAHPMNRLVQGDVVSGKTIVALLAMLHAVGSGYQAALMAPTEILADQHYLTLRQLLEPLGISSVLLAGGRGVKNRKDALRSVAEGEARIVIGTHALIQQKVRFQHLALVVVDEQHKFGVLQRAILKEKGYDPDVLVMTATPIPRTLALTVYGDLDVSVIDAMPPGRTPIRTLLFSDGQRSRAYRVITDELTHGRQAYIVFPLVEDSEKVDLQAAITEAGRLRAVFPRWTVGLLHGRMKSPEKDAVMRDFKDGRIHILVSTTVIEVGIDVPNAGVMLIEHADRFGLAQLHQLRGRVGRGRHQSYCLLMAPARLTEEGRRRLEALVKSHDGFVIAEEDLRIRGPGEFFGTRQWGPADLRVANLIRDASILEQAREEAASLLHKDPDLARPEHAELGRALDRRWRDKLHLARVS